MVDTDTPIYTGRTVDITPTWVSLVLPLLDVYALCDEDDRSFVRGEFMKMAMAADRYIATVDKPGVIATDMLTSEGLRP
jgi:hypothetical protein